MAAFQFWEIKLPKIFEQPHVLLGFLVLLGLGFSLIKIPLRNAGDPDEPAPPTAIM